MSNAIFIRDELTRFLREDLGHVAVDYGGMDGADRMAGGKVVAEEDGVMCGGQLLLKTLELLEPPMGFGMTMSLKDGQPFKQGDPLVAFQTHPEAIRHGIRVGLNLLQHLCGVATRTAQLVRSVEGTGCRLLDTRKTTPGLRAFEKMAVRAGGGFNHRFNRTDGVILKKEDIAFDGGIVTALDRAHKTIAYLSCVEVEVETHEQLLEALSDERVTHVMLDNMSVHMVADAVRIAAGSRARIEASGVAVELLSAFAATGVPAISTSALIIGAKPTKLHFVPDRRLVK